MLDFEQKRILWCAMLEQELATHLKSQYPDVIYEAMGYSVFSKGKRLRPLILLASFYGFSPKKNDESMAIALSFAAAIEMIHTYSLIHDDLPCMDDDDMRRGKPSNHIVFGEAMAVLAGDGLLNLSFEVMTNACLQSKQLPSIFAMQEIAKASGTLGMIGGQVLDLSNENKIADENTLLSIHHKKTAALFSACFCAGAILGGANEQQSAQMAQIGQQLGLAFQIQDDLLDVLSSTNELGKPIGSDEKNHKNTYVSLFGITKAKIDCQALFESVMSSLLNMNQDFEFLLWLVQSLNKKMIN